MIILCMERLNKIQKFHLFFTFYNVSTKKFKITLCGSHFISIRKLISPNEIN